MPVASTPVSDRDEKSSRDANAQRIFPLTRGVADVDATGGAERSVAAPTQEFSKILSSSPAMLLSQADGEGRHFVLLVRKRRNEPSVASLLSPESRM
eukprot:9287256-Pyramimonas_sp.AAC.1